MFTLNSTGLMVGQGLGFAAAGALGLVVPAHQAIALAGTLGLLAVLGLGGPRRWGVAAEIVPPLDGTACRGIGPETKSSG
jgi:hypothetical protein